MSFTKLCKYKSHTLPNGNQVFVWPDLYIAKTSLVNPITNVPYDFFGLFAARDLPSNTFIPYFGKKMSTHNYYSYYVMSSDDNVIFVDADPTIHPYTTITKDNHNISIGCNGKAIAAYVNEGPYLTQRNAKLIGLHENNRYYIGFETTKPIKKDEEILSYYGNEYIRNYFMELVRINEDPTP